MDIISSSYRSRSLCPRFAVSSRPDQKNIFTESFKVRIVTTVLTGYVGGVRSRSVRDKIRLTQSGVKIETRHTASYHSNSRELLVSHLCVPSPLTHPSRCVLHRLLPVVYVRSAAFAGVLRCSIWRVSVLSACVYQYSKGAFGVLYLCMFSNALPLSLSLLFRFDAIGIYLPDTQID